MKKLTLTLLLLASFQFSNAQEYEINSHDTINLIDENGKKQGKWIIRGSNKPGSCYKPENKIEEGSYKDNKKIGIWIQYFCNSKVKNKITFVDGKPFGPTTTYYENGSISEEGTWKNNRWVGNCKIITENGDITEYVFDDKGKEVSKKFTPAKKK